MNHTALQISIVCAVVFSSPAFCYAEETIEPKSKIMLFDGKSFDGWFRYLRNNKSNANPSSGPICLQSEGSPIEFRNIYIEHITN